MCHWHLVGKYWDATNSPILRVDSAPPQNHAPTNANSEAEKPCLLNKIVKKIKLVQDYDGKSDFITSEPLNKLPITHPSIYSLTQKVCR